jgi:hypothetical protein
VTLSALQQEQLDSTQPLDLLVIECDTQAHKQVTQVQNLAKALAAARVLVTYQCCNEQWLAELEQRDIAATRFPPEPGFLAFEMARSVTEKATSLGVFNVGELVAARPRQFSEQELSSARGLQSSMSCGCPEHITDLIRALTSFEEYSASCAVENWQDAAVHSCIYSYTGQARWLMEKALQAALEVHAPQSGSVVQKSRGAHLDDAA